MKANPDFHQASNRIKHEVLDNDFCNNLPALPTGAIQCKDFEVFTEELYTSTPDEGSDAKASVAITPSATICNYCGVWQPIEAAAINSPFVGGDPGGWSPPGPEKVESVTDLSCGGDEADDITDTVLQCQSLSSPVNQSPQMPCLEFNTIRDIGAAVACSWELAELLQPYLALFVEINGGSGSTLTTQ